MKRVGGGVAAGGGDNSKHLASELFTLPERDGMLGEATCTSSEDRSEMLCLLLLFLLLLLVCPRYYYYTVAHILHVPCTAHAWAMGGPQNRLTCCRWPAKYVYSLILVD